ncbi:hypothetical protein IWX47DRAFT_627509 [Phyllosticta citricarpa]|uniref:Uncharacterized protein n=1 Tax=Phyllosticta citricarpa TaxID=55181 RepID=A0ABR1LP21_9PEZI
MIIDSRRQTTVETLRYRNGWQRLTPEIKVRSRHAVLFATVPVANQGLPAVPATHPVHCAICSPSPSLRPMESFEKWLRGRRGGAAHLGERTYTRACGWYWGPVSRIATRSARAALGNMSRGGLSWLAGIDVTVRQFSSRRGVWIQIPSLPCLSSQLAVVILVCVSSGTKQVKSTTQFSQTQLIRQSIVDTVRYTSEAAARQQRPPTRLVGRRGWIPSPIRVLSTQRGTIFPRCWLAATLSSAERQPKLYRTLTHPFLVCLFLQFGDGENARET